MRLLPAREVPLDAAAVKDFRRRYRTRFEGDPTESAIYRGVSEGLAPAGVEFYQPLFFESTATLFDYLPRNAVIVQDAALPEALEQGLGRRSRRATRTAGTTSSARCCRPQELFLEPAQLERGARAASPASPSMPSRPTPSCTGEPPRCATSRPARRASCGSTSRAEQPFAPLDAS